MAAIDSITLPVADDWHMHLRQGDMSRAVVPLIRPAGVQRGIVMPNTIPPVTSGEMAMQYREKLLKHDPSVDFKMLLYLCPQITPEHLEHCKENFPFVTGIKSYPRGVALVGHESIGRASSRAILGMSFGMILLFAKDV